MKTLLNTVLTIDEQDAINGTSFYDDTITTTVKNLREILGEPDSECNDGSDKVNFDWARKTEDGVFFTVYDWKEYRPLKETERIEFHIGAQNVKDSRAAYHAITKALRHL